MIEEMDSTKRWRCPVRKILALALADDVFVHVKSPEELGDRWMNRTARSRIIEIKAEKRHLPILRRIEDKKVSESQIMSAPALNSLVKDICEQCGYTENVTACTFRRGFANKVEGERIMLSLILC